MNRVSTHLENMENLEFQSGPGNVRENEKVTEIVEIYFSFILVSFSVSFRSCSAIILIKC